MTVAAVHSGSGAPQKKSPVRRFSVVLFAMVLLGAARAIAQQHMAPGSSAEPKVLTLDEALLFAIANNPEYRARKNGRRVASANLVAARGALLPTISASLTGQYIQGGTQFVSGSALGASSDVLQSQYGVQIDYRVDMSRFIAPRAVRATADAVNAEIAADSTALVNRVKRSYLDALQSSAQSALEDSLVAITETELSLARAKEALGTGTIVDVRRAEITLGQQRVARLRAVSQTYAAQVLLFREIGVTQPPQNRLADSPQLPAQLPTLEQLLQLAKKSNPGLVALSYWETARDLDVVRARTAYAPVLDLSTGIGGYTYSYRDPSFLVSQARADLSGAHAACIANQEVRQALGLSGTLAECDRFLFSEAQAEALRRRNDRFPFSFSPTPRAFVAQLSLPILDRFVTRQRIQTARLEQENASYATKAMTLDIEAKTTTAYDLVGTAAEIVSLENKNADQARIELTSAHERYAIGLETFLGLSTARSTYAQAEKDRIGAKYDYERAVVELENAVGHSIR